MRGASLRAALALAVVAAALEGRASDLAVEPARLPASSRYELGSDVDPLRSLPPLRHPSRGRLDDFRGDPVDALPTTLEWTWDKLRRDLDPQSNLGLASRFRDFFQKAAEAKGPAILGGLLKTSQEVLLERARAALGSRRERVQLRRALDRRAATLDREVRVLVARARRRGRSGREDGRVRRARERLRQLERARADVLGTLPVAELSLPRLAAYRDRLAMLVARKVRELHSGADQALRGLR